MGRVREGSQVQTSEEILYVLDPKIWNDSKHQDFACSLAARFGDAIRVNG